MTFSTHLAPMTRGIMATMYMTATEKTATEDLIELYQSVYENDPFIRIHSNGSFQRQRMLVARTSVILE